MLTSMILYLGTVFWCVCWCDTSCACGVLVGDHMVQHNLSRVCSGATRCVDVPATRYRWSVATQTPPNPHLTQSHAFHKAHTNFIFSSTSLNAILIFYLRFLLLSILFYDFSSPRNCPVCKIWTAKWTSVQVL